MVDSGSSVPVRLQHSSHECQSSYRRMVTLLVLVSLVASLAQAGPTLYKLDRQRNTAERVMVAVASTGGSATGN